MPAVRLEILYKESEFDLVKMPDAKVWQSMILLKNVI